MKKQFLFLAMFVLAVFAGINKSYGQIAGASGVNLTPRVVDCVSATLDGLNPVPGTEYTYEVDVPTPAAGTKTYNWFATQDPNFITSKVLLTGATVDKGDGTDPLIQKVNTTPADASSYNKQDATTKDKIYITWKAFDPSKETFLVVYVQNDNCTTDNLKVYLIKPVNAFTLDVAVIDTTLATPAALAYGATKDICMPNIVTAHYNTTDKKVEYDFGKTTMWFYIAAANFNDSYDLNFKLTNVDAQEGVKFEWSYNTATPSWSTLALGGTAAAGYTAKQQIDAQAATKQVGAAGESIIVRITLDHTVNPTQYFEGTAAEAVTLAIDGQTGVDAGGDGTRDTPDVHYACSGSPAAPVSDGFTNDIAIENLNPRPAVTPTNPNAFIPIEGK